MPFNSDHSSEDRYAETFKTWDKLAPLYQDKFMDLDLYNESYDFICNYLTADKAKILEIGCGPGNITRYLLTKRPDFDISGIDISPNMIELARKNNPSARFDVMDARDIGNIKTKFDAVICGFCLPFLSPADGLKMLKDAAALLNPKGLIYISFVHGDPRDSDYRTGSTGDKVYFHYCDKEELKAQFQSDNLQVIKLFELLYNPSESRMETHTIMIACKNA